MKVLLIMPYNCDLIHAVSFPMGLISIATYLNEHGHTAQICDFSVSHNKIEQVFDSFKPDIAGVSLGSVKSVDGALYISKKLKKKGCPVVWGGPFCDVAIPQHIFDSGVVDYISFSEGEATWLDIMNRLSAGADFSDVPGIAYMKNGEMIKTPDREFLDLTTLPQLDYSLVDVKAYFQYLYGCERLVYVYLSKGCPAKCNFCTNTLSHRCTYRRRSLSQFMSETKKLVEDYGVDGLYFSDELCFLDRGQLYEVCDEFDKAGLGFKWGFQTRIGILGEEDFIRAHKSGCRWVDFGVESGNREMLKKIRKGIPYDKIIPTFEACDKAGIISLANFIVGFPDETQAQVHDTVNMALSIKATQCTFMQYCWSPLTEGGREVTASGKMKKKLEKLSDYRKTDFFLSKMTNLSSVPRKELEVIQSYFLWNAIFRKDYGDDTRSYDLMIKHIKTLFTRLSYLDFVSGVKCFYELAVLFLRFFNDTHFHPGIIKKYNLK